jgi:hypothetical protein
MAIPSPEAGEAPARAARPRWPWVFAAIFLALTGSAAYLVTRPVPLARRMDATRSGLAPRAEGGVVARVLVLGVPRDGEVRAVATPPRHGGERWRIDVQWTAEPAAKVETARGERLFEVPIPEDVREVEVWDRRGGLTPERMVLTWSGPDGP